MHKHPTFQENDITTKDKVARRMLSLLELVSEMSNVSKNLKLKADQTIHYAGRNASVTDNETHGGFDNDRATMNNVLKNILGRKPTAAKGFQPEDVTGY